MDCKEVIAGGARRFYAASVFDRMILSQQARVIDVEALEAALRH